MNLKILKRGGFKGASQATKLDLFEQVFFNNLGLLDGRWEILGSSGETFTFVTLVKTMA